MEILFSYDITYVVTLRCEGKDLCKYIVYDSCNIDSDKLSKPIHRT